MGLSASEIVTPLLGALQASVSVLLTIFIGVLIAQFGLLDGDAAKQVSRTGVRIFLPALLITKVGSELHAGTVGRYVPILIWAIIYNLVSMVLGTVCTRAFKLPAWVTPALTFNNTTSLPLLLIQSLQSTGILDSILVGHDTAAAAIGRAESYFLVNAMVSNSLTFALGPRLLKPHDEEVPNGRNEGQAKVENRQADDQGSVDQSEQRQVDEESSLLPQPVIQHSYRLGDKIYDGTKPWWDDQPHWIRTTLDIMYSFVNAPLIGAAIGALIGLVPILHVLFFAETADGGYFNAWLTEPVKNAGGLFATLQVLVVGVKLSQSLRKMKQGEDSGRVPWSIVGFVSVVRFLVWPACLSISVPVIWALAQKTSLLANDPVLWFCMMLIPTGPSAMILVALSDVNGSDETEKMAIAKLLTILYAITPLISIAVVGALKATESVIGS
ncbi:hypothetical protein LTR62_001140 [Meristemomyces frigidus]|uniref:Auxin efflux carrier n=1 Tax=Meristemomyces frigidus TaxID=1508187 RepID=A0AAN7TSZ2_9PEZI|nr:hypothetical protein LTR62_001140 [Meristemomyces frigidus]